MRFAFGRGASAGAPLETFERLLRGFAAVNPRRAEEDDGVLDVLRLEAAERLEILGQDPERARFFALEKLRIEVRERLEHP